MTPGFHKYPKDPKYPQATGKILNKLRQNLVSSIWYMWKGGSGRVVRDYGDCLSKVLLKCEVFCKCVRGHWDFLYFTGRPSLYAPM